MGDETAVDDAIRRKLQSRPFDALIAALAERQHGTVARRQLIALGMHPRAIDRRIAAGRLHRIHRGVYAVGHKRLTREGRLIAAVLAAGPGAVLSHRSAAALHGIRRHSGKIEITVPTTPPRSAAFVARRSQLQPDELTEISGIPATTVARTLLDLATVISRPELDSAIREADYLRSFDLRAVETLLLRYPRRSGRARLRAALAEATYGTGTTRKELEARFRRLALAAKLPPPEFNATIELGATTFEVDVLWRKQHVIVELDSWQAHGTRDRFESDRERDRKLKLAGYEVLRVTWRQLEAAIADLQALLSGRATPACASPRTPALPRGSPR
jgi:predicted transcriptional regulator of viral defense system